MKDFTAHAEEGRFMKDFTALCVCFSLMVLCWRGFVSRSRVFFLLFTRFHSAPGTNNTVLFDLQCPIQSSKIALRGNTQGEEVPSLEAFSSFPRCFILADVIEDDMKNHESL
jgi:hypothetical protein